MNHRATRQREFRQLRAILAVERVHEAVFDLQLAIEREQQRQSRRSLWMNVLFAARLPPHSPQTIIPLPIRAPHRLRRRVMQEAAKRAPAERFVVARVENELVPQVVHDLRWHRDVLLAALEIREE